MEHNVDIIVKENKMNWNLDEKGVLTIKGQNKIPHYDCGSHPSAPWKDISDQIIEIHIMEGMTEIGINAFKGCENLEKVILPHSLRRIHAYAFWNCNKLVSIVSDRDDFKYIYDDRDYAEDNTLIFGVESFYNVPWSKIRWGDFYTRDNMLYVTFSKVARRLTLPEGITVLKSFSMNYLAVDLVVLPGTLETIEDFAFSNSIVKEKMLLPDSVSQLAPYALADCSILWQDSDTMKEIVKRRRKLPKEHRKRMPAYFNHYSVASIKRKSFEKFRMIKVIEKQPKRKIGDRLQSFVVDEEIDVGNSIYRRIRSGKVILCITYENNRIISVKSFVWSRKYELPAEYLMYPVYEKRDGLLPWRDSFVYHEKEDIIAGFVDLDGAALKEKGVLRLRHPDTHEEWFWSDDKENFGGPLEMQCLETWLSLHSDITVDSTAENKEKDWYRLFVDV